MAASIQLVHLLRKAGSILSVRSDRDHDPLAQRFQRRAQALDFVADIVGADEAPFHLVVILRQAVEALL